MPDNEETLIPPVEIPWRLASTTRTLNKKGTFPEGSSISVFTYTPADDSIAKDPDLQLVYLRLSISLASDPIDFPGAPEPIQSLLQGGLPVWASVVDARISPESGGSGGWMPHFLAASPMRRSVIESGVVGDDLFEGESSGLAIGKSGSQLHEAFSTTTTGSSRSSGGGLSLPLIGGLGVGKTSRTTSIEGTRDVFQVTDSTTRAAAEEREQLFSHLTRVDNVLSLLSATGVGTPHLRWALSPRPLRQLTIDPTDPSSWYGELLRWRSSGLSGVQDLYAVAAVPRNSNEFCLDVILRNVYVLDKAPTPPVPPENLFDERGKFWQYLYSKYPAGTPIDDLDVDLTKMPAVSADWDKTLEQPVIDAWPLYRRLDKAETDWVFCALVRGIKDYDFSTFHAVAYKTMQEVNLECQIDEYRRALATSPLVRGKIMATPLELSLCFDVGVEGAVGPPGGGVKPKPESVAIERKDPILPFLAVEPQVDPLPPTSLHSKYELDVARKAIIGWNDLDRRVLHELTTRPDWGNTPLSWNDPGVRTVWLRHLEALAPDDPANQPLKDARQWLGLSTGELRQLKNAGVTDLRGMAVAILHAKEFEWLESENRKLKPMLERLRLETGNVEAPADVSVQRLSVGDAAALDKRLGKRLVERLGNPIRRSQ